MVRAFGRAGIRLWAAAVLVVLVSVVWGRSYQREAPAINLGAAPLVGPDPLDGWDWRLRPGRAGVIAGAVVVAVARGWWWRMCVKWVVATASLGAAAFALALALTHGADGVLRGAAHETEYLANLPVAPPAAEFVRRLIDSSFVEVLLDPSDERHEATRAAFEVLLDEYVRGAALLYRHVGVVTQCDEGLARRVLGVCHIASPRPWLSQQTARVESAHPELGRGRATTLVPGGTSG